MALWVTPTDSDWIYFFFPGHFVGLWIRMINVTVYFIRNTCVTLLRKGKIKYNWPYLISFPTGNIAWQKAGATGTSLYLSHVCHIQILWNLGKKPFSYLVINPCYITIHVLLIQSMFYHPSPVHVLLHAVY